MEKLKDALSNIQEINAIYDLEDEKIQKTQKEMETAKVCMPIIGRFSAGKSALLNTLLGYSRSFLKENINPQTAVPTEIVYTNMEETVTVYNKDGSIINIDTDEYRELWNDGEEPHKVRIDVDTVEKVRLNLQGEIFLKEIPDVMLVDMPGFDSGNPVHDRAIDEYLPKSLAYILAFPADDMTFKNSTELIRFLKELCLHDTPLCVVITKYDKRNEEEFESTFALLKDNLKRYVGDKKITYCITSSTDGNVEDVKVFLKEIQEQSQQILENRFKRDVLSVAINTENYLNAALKNSKLSESQRTEEQERIKKQLEGLSDKYAQEKEEFEKEIQVCIEDIKSDVQRALEDNESALIRLIETQQDNQQKIKDYLKSIVRNTVTKSVRDRLIPKFEKYLKKISGCMNSDGLGDVTIDFNLNIEKISKGIVSAVVASAVTVFILGLPVIGAIIGGIVYAFNKASGEKKREEQKAKIQMELRTNTYPNIMKEVGKGLEMEVTNQMTAINQSIESEMNRQRETLEKAMEDIQKQITEEQEKKKNLFSSIEYNLKTIGEIKDELR